jgi:hypothetical protein
MPPTTERTLMLKYQYANHLSMVTGRFNSTPAKKGSRPNVPSFRQRDNPLSCKHHPITCSTGQPTIRIPQNRSAIPDELALLCDFGHANSWCAFSGIREASSSNPVLVARRSDSVSNGTQFQKGEPVWIRLTITLSSPTKARVRA